MSTIKANRYENTSTASGGLDIDTSGNVRVTTLADSAGNNDSTPAEIASGRAKAWVNCVHDGTVSDSFNVSSVTDNGSADLTVNFTTAFANDDYCMTGGAIYSNGVGTGYGMPTIKEADSAGNPTTKTVSACRVETMHSQSASNPANTVAATNTQLQIYMVFHGS